MELFRALGALTEPPSEQTAELCRLLGLGPPPGPGEFEDIFVFQLYPYASVYLGAEGQIGGEARDRIAGFWRALDLVPPVAPDHLALMLSLYARLTELEGNAGSEPAREGWRNARKAWLWEHVLSWLPVYLDRMKELGGGTYGAWATTLARALQEEAGDLGPPALLPLHLREAPPLVDPRGSEHEGTAATFVRQLLSPARTGFVLLGSDLGRAAHELGLALRAGERRFVLESLFAQAAEATLDWLARFASDGARRLEVETPLGAESILGFWIGRARSSAALLRDLAADAALSRDPADA